MTLDVAYGYDSYGRLETLTTPSGQLLSYEYTDGRVSGLKVNGSYLLSSISYLPFGPATGWTWGNSTETTREYDTDGQLVAISSAGLSTYTFNDDGTIATRSDDFVSDVPISDGTTTFTVDSASNQLTAASGDLSRSYGYDAAGNLKRERAKRWRKWQRRFEESRLARTPLRVARVQCSNTATGLGAGRVLEEPDETHLYSIGRNEQIA
jgi:hypothetical protein